MLNCSTRNIESVVSYPRGAQRLYLDSDPFGGFDFSNDSTVIHIILAYNALTRLDIFKFPPQLQELDLSGNAFTTIPKGIIPDALGTLYLSDCVIPSMNSIALPAHLNALFLDSLHLKTINFPLPSELDALSVNENPLTSLENFTLPDSLTAL